MLPPPLSRYLEKRAFPGPWSLAGDNGSGLAGAVVIPALAESGDLFATLDSLAANPQELLRRFLVVVVVNHRADATVEEKEDNRRTRQRLESAGNAPKELRLAWVDAASPGRELPPGEGVGLARKLGFDLVLPRLDWRGTPILASLDADTLVESTYLPALLAHFRTAREGGAVLPFCHRPGATPDEGAAILRYELFLRHYVLGLTLAGSPYAFHTVGSALACTAAAYLRAGGMNRRQAAEDFYFLQQLARTAGVAELAGTVVHPSPRPSGRVPFGTGASVARQLAGKEAVRFYPAEAFRLVGAWLDLVQREWQAPADDLLDRAQQLSPALAAFLAGLGLPAVWERLRRQHRQRQARLAAFHGWFDALRTLRLVRHLGAGPPQPDAATALPPLLRWAGLEAAAEPQRQLALLRARQGAGPPAARN